MSNVEGKVRRSSLPRMQQETDGEIIHLLEEVPALIFCLARLPHQRLPKWVVTLNQVTDVTQTLRLRGADVVPIW